MPPGQAASDPRLKATLRHRHSKHGFQGSPGPLTGAEASLPLRAWTGASGVQLSRHRSRVLRQCPGNTNLARKDGEGCPVLPAHPPAHPLQASHRPASRLPPAMCREGHAEAPKCSRCLFVDFCTCDFVHHHLEKTGKGNTTGRMRQTKESLCCLFPRSRTTTSATDLTFLVTPKCQTWLPCSVPEGLSTRPFCSGIGPFHVWIKRA